MTRELVGQLLGWLIVTAAAWFLALAVMAYGLGDAQPWNWTVEQRFTHLGIQLAFVISYALYRRPRAREE